MSGILTYSPAYTLVPTYECFNRCTYCNFRSDPGEDNWITLEQATAKLRPLQQTDVCEILILSGEIHPRSPRRRRWIDLIYNLCQLALDGGFLPHTNAGILSYQEMARLKQVNVSMGLMLEQLTPALLSTVHQHAPSKLPQLRLEQLHWAGELQIPFTTGLLLGIGETPEDWRTSLEAIAAVHQRWGHIQEVILQPHSPGSQQILDAAPFNPAQLPEVVAIARQLLPGEIALQIPPNLISDFETLCACLEAGATDLGGISPFDEVNPDYHHPRPQTLSDRLENAGWKLRPRLPVYPQYLNWLPQPLQQQSLMRRKPLEPQDR